MNIFNLLIASRPPVISGIAPAGSRRPAQRRFVGRYSAIPDFSAEGNVTIPALAQTQISKSRSSSHVQQSV